MKKSMLDPDVAALALFQSVVLLKTIELAGTVRDGVYDCMTEHEHVFKATNRMFTAAVDALPRAPDSVEVGFARALRAADFLQDRAAGTVREIIQEEVKESMVYLAHRGANQAVADRFAATFPDGAVALAKQSSGRHSGPVRLNYLSMMAQAFQTAVPRGPPGWPLDEGSMAVLDRAASAAASRAADGGGTLHPPHSPWPRQPRQSCWSSSRTIRRDFCAAPGICSKLSRAISLAGGPQKLASSVPAAMLGEARRHHNNVLNASWWVSVRGLSAAHTWVTTQCAISAFRAAFGIAAGAAWATTGDRARFESTYDRALEAAGMLDSGARYAFDTLMKHSWEKMPFNDAYGDTWQFFYGLSGCTMAEWVKVAQGADYRALARAQENATPIGVYGAARDGALRMLKAGR